jgi:hypothetical protein
MDKIFDTTRFYRFLMVYMMLCICTIPLASAQGFFTQTNHAFGGEVERIELLPDGGYRIKSAYFPQQGGPNNARFYSTLDLSAAGTEISYDSIYRLNDSFPTAFPLAWLADNDVLEFVSSFDANNWALIKYHLNGTPAWTHLIPSIYDYRFIQDVAQNELGETFLITEEYDGTNPPAERHLFLRKLDVNGALLWSINQTLPGLWKQRNNRIAHSKRWLRVWYV